MAFSVHEGDHLTLLNVYKAFISHKKSGRFCHNHFLNYRGETDRQTDRLFYFSKSSMNTITSLKVKLSRVISADSAAHLLQKVCPLLIYK